MPKSNGSVPECMCMCGSMPVFVCGRVAVCVCGSMAVCGKCLCYDKLTTLENLPEICEYVF